MSDRKYYVFHEGSGTVIAMDECTLVQMDDATEEAVSSGEQEAPAGQKVDDPWRAIWFTGTAIREHYENANQPNIVEGLTDADLAEAGEWALNSSFLWDAVYTAWKFGLAQVRAEREAGRNEPE